MIRILLKIAHPIRKLYWRIVRPTTEGVRAILVNEMGQILLVQHNYQEGWFLPGGKMHRNEDTKTALRRELKEELGVGDIFAPIKLGEYTNTYEYKKDTITVFVVMDFSMSSKSHFEISKVQYFSPEGLPHSISPGTRRRVEEWLGMKPIATQW